MRFIKLGFISIVVLFLILTALGLLMPSTVRVTRNINIHASPGTMHDYIDDIKNWPLWMESIDAKSISFSSGQTKGQGALAHVSTLSIRITKDDKNTVESIWKSGSGKEQLCVFEFYPDSTTNNINLNWYFEQKLHWYPWERLPAIANDKVMSPFMEKSLDKLKVIAEANGI